MRKLIQNPYFSGPYGFLLIFSLIILVVVPYGEEILFFNASRTPVLNTFFKGVTLLGEPPMWGIAVVILGFLKEKQMAIALALTGLTLLPVTYISKHYIGVDRPITYFERQNIKEKVVLVPDLQLNTGQTSFPSGHTSSAFALYGLLAAFYHYRKPQKYFIPILAVLVASFIGFSRIFLVQHFLIDVVAGSVLGLALASLGFFVFEKIKARFPPKSAAQA